MNTVRSHTQYIYFLIFFIYGFKNINKSININMIWNSESLLDPPTVMNARPCPVSLCMRNPYNCLTE